ncbi:hypothetical protein ACQZ6Q_33170, partial [Rhizobium rhizogenes]
SPLSDVVANITLAHCDAVGRGHPLHQFCVETNSWARIRRLSWNVRSSSINRQETPFSQSSIKTSSHAISL